jgi:hypothetical protein
VPMGKHILSFGIISSVLSFVCFMQNHKLTKDNNLFNCQSWVNCAPLHRGTHFEVDRKPKLIMLPIRYHRGDFFKLLFIEIMRRAVHAFYIGLIFKEKLFECFPFFGKMPVQSLDELNRHRFPKFIFLWHGFNAYFSPPLQLSAA